MKKDYYWRDYVEEIPSDAIPGGFDSSGKPIYIGQALHHQNLLVGTIYPGRFDIAVTYLSNAISSKFGKKILCGKNENCFKWETATSSTLHLMAIGKHLVIGGYENGRKINIGRVQCEGTHVIGKVISCRIDDAQMYHCFKNKEVPTKSYEVLTYVNSDAP